MHILLIHQNFAALDEPGGTRHHETARYLAHEGFRVTVVTSGVSYLTGSASGRQHRDQHKYDNGGVTILHAYTYPALHRSFVHRVFSFISFMISSLLTGLKVKDVDLVWGTSPPIFQGFTAWLLARLKKVPFVFEVRDLWPAFAIAVGVLRQPLLIRLSEWLERFLYSHADLVIVNSPGFIEHVQQRGAKKIEVVPNGADPRMFEPCEDMDAVRKPWLMERHVSGEQPYVVLYAGAHGMSNDLTVVLEAAKLLEERPDIAIVLLGDGKEKPALIAQAHQMGLANLHFAPPVPKTQMAQALSAADACLAILKPIPMYETVYPNKVFDYMAAGKPVVLAIGGVIREVIDEAKCGLPVPPGDPQALASAIAWLADHPKEGLEMGCRGRREIEKRFDRANLATQLGDIFWKLREKA